MPFVNISGTFEDHPTRTVEKRINLKLKTFPSAEVFFDVLNHLLCVFKQSELKYEITKLTKRPFKSKENE